MLKLMAQWDHIATIHVFACDVGEHVMTQSLTLMLPRAELIYAVCVAMI